MAIAHVYVDYGAGNDSTGDGSVGTPWKTLQKAYDTLTRDTTDGNQVNVKAGTAQVLAAAQDLTTLIAGGALSGTAPLIIRGYTSAANDGGIGEIDCGGFPFFAATTYDFIILRDLEIHNGGNNDLVTLDTYCEVVNCEFHAGASTPSGKYLLVLAGNATVLGNHFHHPGTNGWCSKVTNGSLYYGNHFEVTSGAYGGLYLNSGNPSNVFVTRNIFRLANATGWALYGASAGSWWAADNDFYNSGAGVGAAVTVFGSRNMQTVINSIFEGWSGVNGEAIDIAANAGLVTTGYNAFRNNTANYTAGDVVHTDLGNDDTLGASPWVNAGTGDFDINGTVAGVTEDAYPAAFLGLASTSPKADKGAVQAGAGAGGTEAHTDDEVLDTASTPGTVHLPDAAEVISTATFGVNSGTSGTVVQASVGDVEAGVTYGPSSGLTGTFVVPAEEDVESGVTYGASAEFTGTLVGGGGLTAQQVADALKLAPSAGAAAAGSVYATLASILEDTGTTIPAEFAALADETDIADAVLARDLGSGTNAGAAQERTVRSALRFLRNKWTVAAGTLTVTTENDTTTAWTAAVTGTAGAAPVTGSDPT